MLVCTNLSSATAAIEHLHAVSCSLALLASDSAASFTGEEFQYFITLYRINHVISAPHHPSSNGLAERSVEIVKNGLRKLTESTIDSRLAKILFAHHISPQSTTGTSPSELMLNRRHHCRLDLIFLNEWKAINCPRRYTYHKTTAKIIINDPVLV